VSKTSQKRVIKHDVFSKNITGNLSRPNFTQRKFTDYLNHYEDGRTLSVKPTQSDGKSSGDDEIKRLQDIVLHLQEEIQRMQKESAIEPSKVMRVHYRKNMRVCYIPKKWLYDKVLEKLKERHDEPIRVTIEKVFIAAAKHLGVNIEHEG